MRPDGDSATMTRGVGLTRGWALALLAIVIALSCCLASYWTEQKVSFMMDEVISFQRAHYWNNPDDYEVLYGPSRWADETWVEGSLFRDECRIPEGGGALENPDGIVDGLFSEVTYFGILNVVESLWYPEPLDKHAGIWINVVVLAATLALLYALLREMGISRAFSLLACAMYGTSGVVIGLVNYVRFYVLATFLMLFAVYLHAIMWNRRRLLVDVACTVASFWLLYFAIRNTQLATVVCAALALTFSFGLLLSRRFLEFFCYTVPVAVAGYVVTVVKEDYFRVILNIGAYASGEIQSGNRRHDVANSILSATGESVGKRLEEYAGWVFDYLFGHPRLAFLFAVMVAVLAVLALARQRLEPAGGPGAGEDDRAQEGGDAPRQRGFVWVVLLTALLYTLALAVANREFPRYLSPVFPLYAVALWKCLDHLAEGMADRRVVTALLAALVVACGVCTSTLHQFEYIYLEDLPLKQRLEAYDDADVILLSCSGNKHYVFDFTDWCDDDTRIYMISPGHHAIDPEELSDEALVWMARGVDPSPYITELTAAGYETLFVGRDHCSDVYVCIWVEGLAEKLAAAA